ncbi:IST1-like protein [Linum grandiflorum]
MWLLISLYIFRECPGKVREAVASIIFASPRCSEVPDLLHVKNLFTATYGKEFVMAASELRPDSGVNRAIIEKLSVGAPAPEERLKVLKEIAREYNLEWDSSETEAELNKRHEDLLAGSKQAEVERSQCQIPIIQSSPSPRSTFNGTSEEQNVRVQEASSPIIAKIKNDEIVVPPSIKNHNQDRATDGRKDRNVESSDILEVARAAITAAERATAAARAAAFLVSVNSTCQKLQ